MSADTSNKHVRPFAEFLVEQRTGAAHAEISEAFNDLVAAVQQYRKSGELTLKIVVKPADGGGSTVLVSDKVSLKLPEGDRPVALFFIDGDSNLTRRDPNQPSLPLRALGGDEDEIPEPTEAQQ